MGVLLYEKYNNFSNKSQVFCENFFRFFGIANKKIPRRFSGGGLYHESQGGGLSHQYYYLTRTIFFVSLKLPAVSL